MRVGCLGCSTQQPVFFGSCHSLSKDMLPWMINWYRIEWFFSRVGCKSLLHLSSFFLGWYKGRYFVDQFRRYPSCNPITDLYNLSRQFHVPSPLSANDVLVKVVIDFLDCPFWQRILCPHVNLDFPHGSTTLKLNITYNLYVFVLWLVRIYLPFVSRTYI